MKKLSAILAMFLAFAPLMGAKQGPESISEATALPATTYSPLSAPANQAPDSKWEIGIGISTVPIFNMLFPYALGGLSHQSANNVSDGRENSLDIEAPIGLNLNVRRNVTNWLSIGCTVTGQYFSKRIYHSGTSSESGGPEEIYRGTHSLSVISIMPTFRFNYLSKPNLTLYGELMGGVALYSRDQVCQGNQNSQDSDQSFSGAISGSFQVTPIGVTCGRKVYFLAEIGFGMQWCGAQVGVGFRF